MGSDRIQTGTGDVILGKTTLFMSDAITRSRIAISLVCLSLDACPGLDGFNRVYESWQYFGTGCPGVLARRRILILNGNV